MGHSHPEVRTNKTASQPAITHNGMMGKQAAGMPAAVMSVPPSPKYRGQTRVVLLPQPAPVNNDR